MLDPYAPIDLHTHTTASDGTLTPAQLVEAARDCGLAAIAVTDHDTVAGVPEAVRAGRERGVEVIPGVEISAEHRPAGRPPAEHRRGVIHILGYLIDCDDEGLTRALSWMRERRTARNPEIIRRLNDLGIEIGLEDAARHAGGGQVGRPHIAQALVDRGVVASVREAFDQFLHTGGPAMVEKEKLTPEAAVRIINDAGGVAVLAHPYQMQIGDGDALDETVRSLADVGLGGIECYYSGHSPDRTERYLELARSYGLAVTGGSDFHGTTKPDIPLGIHPPVPYRLIDGLRKRRSVRRTS